MKLFDMSSADKDRSLTSGIPIPHWMKNKSENYGFDPSALSPPTHEGDFFYMKYQKPQKQTDESLSLKSLDEIIELKKEALTKHTDSCKQFIPKIKDTVQVEKPKIKKPMGVDDGFKGEGAACGASVVEVAHQMLSGKGKTQRSLNVLGAEETNLAPPSSSYMRTRRNSKSLPVSPVTSPGGSPLTNRKNLHNRLFGMNFQKAVENNLSDSDDNLEKKWGSSWILSSLFASSKDPKDSGKELGKDEGSMVEEKNSGKVVNYRKPVSSNASAGESVNSNVAVEMGIAPPATLSKGSFFKSKPFLRDLNLLTPSST